MTHRYTILNTIQVKPKIYVKTNLGQGKFVPITLVCFVNQRLSNSPHYQIKEEKSFATANNTEKH